MLTRDQNNPNAPEEERKVVQVFQHTVYSLEDVTITGSDGVSETIRCTPEHPFYVQGQGWTGSSHLVAGEHLVQADGSVATVISATGEAHPEGVTVYNFEVEGDHTYFVDQGGDAVWVHNSCTDFTAELARSKGSARRVLDQALGGAVGDTFAAHHLIPLDAIASTRGLLERAARGGFNINGVANGVLLDQLVVHVGGHPSYIAYVARKLSAISPHISDIATANTVAGIADQLRAALLRLSSQIP